MTQLGNDFREAKEAAIEKAVIRFGKHKGKIIVETVDPDYWTWLRSAEAWEWLGKFEKEAVKRMMYVYQLKPKKRPGMIVTTAKGIKGRTYNDEELVDGRIRVHADRFKLLCDPKTLTVNEYID